MSYNLSRIRSKTAYDTQEISQLLNVNRKTILRWLKEGLQLIDPVKTPKLIMGNDLKIFLYAKRALKQTKLGWNEFYCLRCRKPVVAKRGTERTEKTGKIIGSKEREQTIIFGSCKECACSVARIF